ncbi:hypothetical protein TNCV_4073831 [Trichonephila clavipes]|uniref:Uncharacterized protein n=1 Tax=Trichonephila clavipes TaxID=2585209 RepID=A0A8X6W8G0_TRICX|nr:hypothetical protein TNCV_4073831 [Trichonephila clavipes]
MLYKDQTIKIAASCDVWKMTKLVVNVPPLLAITAATRLGKESKRLWMYPWGTAVPKHKRLCFQVKSPIQKLGQKTPDLFHEAEKRKDNEKKERAKINCGTSNC